MPHVMLRPAIRTSGGEAGDLEVDGKYAGTLTLVWREGDRLTGSIQLDRLALSREEKRRVSEWADEYVGALGDALGVGEVEVVVTAGTFDHLISSHEEPWAEEDRQKEGAASGPAEDHQGMAAEETAFTVVPVRDDGNALTYDIYEPSRGGLPVGRAVIDLSGEGEAVSGMIEFRDSPDEREREEMAAAVLAELEKETSFGSANLTMMAAGRWLEDLYFENRPMH